MPLKFDVYLDPEQLHKRLGIAEDSPNKLELVEEMVCSTIKMQLMVKSFYGKIEGSIDAITKIHEIPSDCGIAPEWSKKVGHYNFVLQPKYIDTIDITEFRAVIGHSYIDVNLNAGKINLTGLNAWVALYQKNSANLEVIDNQEVKYLFRSMGNRLSFTNETAF